MGNKILATDKVQATIMIVGHDAVFLRYLHDVLSVMDYGVQVSEGLKPALTLAGQSPPDMILLDADMPERNACEACSSLKAAPALNTVPVIAIHSLLDEQLISGLFKCACVDYISKPFSADELQAKIKLHLALARVEDLENERERKKNIEKQYYTQLKNLTDAIIHVNERGVIIYNNPMAEKCFDYGEGELIGKTVESLISEKYRRPHQLYRQKYTQMPRTSDMRDAINVFGQKKNGEAFPVSISLSTLYSEQGIFVSAEIRDISEQYSLTKELERQHRFLGDAFSKTTDGLLLANVAGEIIYSNLAIEHQFGYSRDELVGKQMQFLYDHEDEYEKVLLQINASIDVAESKPCIVTYRRKDMTTFVAEVNAIQTKDNVEGDEGYFFIIRDISERLLMEEEHKSLVKQLLQAQKMEALGQLTSGVAHDFNNILASMMGFTELAMDLVEEEPELELQDIKVRFIDYLNEVHNSGKRAQSLISQMLTFSRTGHSGKQGPFDMSILVHEAIKLLRPVLPSSISIRADMQKSIPLVMADPVQLHQVVMNICINARDAMEGKGRIEIGLGETAISNLFCASCQQQVEGQYLELAISDSGPGIHAKVLERLFEPFFTTKKTGKGTGMGLAMAHGIMHRHDGHIIVASEPGLGSTFRLLFPLHIPAVEAESCQQTEELDAVT